MFLFLIQSDNLSFYLASPLTLIMTIDTFGFLYIFFYFMYSTMFSSCCLFIELMKYFLVLFPWWALTLPFYHYHAYIIFHVWFNTVKNENKFFSHFWNHKKALILNTTVHNFNTTLFVCERECVCVCVCVFLSDINLLVILSARFCFR